MSQMLEQIQASRAVAQAKVRELMTRLNTMNTNASRVSLELLDAEELAADYDALVIELERKEGEQL